MANIQWQEAQSSPSGDRQPGRNVWFSVSLALLGVIVGFTLGKMQSTALVAQIPPAAPPSVPAQEQPAPEPSGPVPAVDFAADHVRGDKDGATVAVIEYSDFQCPYCKRVHPTYQQIMQEYGDKVVWVYRHYPLSFHPNAQALAEGAECVAEQKGNDGFWLYADAVYGDMDVNADAATVKAAITKTAADIGVNAVQFRTCLDGGKYAQKVQDQMDAGAAAGVSGTPGNFVYNLRTNEATPVNGAQPFAAFKTAIDAQL
ncbi:MAG: DsbA family protein [Candidatus Peribacteraceae bacterium]|nr:DsbA family protein [Candidatus Peribacteraceae bacterium]